MDTLKEFTKTFDALCYGQTRGKVFSDFVEIAACTVHQVPYHTGIVAKDADYERIEQAYMAAVGRYDKEQLEKMAQLYSVATIGVAERRDDFLGMAYMQLEISNANAGQFFTPSSLQRMMAEMTLTDAGGIIQEKGFITVSDPAAGAGGMLIEAANVIQAQGFDPRQTMWVQAVDIDRTCFNMAYFQLSTLGLCGEVVHGNTLSMENWETRRTPQWRMMQATMPKESPEAVAAGVAGRIRGALDELRAAATEATAPAPSPAEQLRQPRTASVSKPATKGGRQLELDLG